jgi:hypothetical protein
MHVGSGKVIWPLSQIPVTSPDFGRRRSTACDLDTAVLDAVLSKESCCRVGAVDLEALVAVALLAQADVMEDAAEKQQLSSQSPGNIPRWTAWARAQR